LFAVLGLMNVKPLHAADNRPAALQKYSIPPNLQNPLLTATPKLRLIFG